MRRGLVTALFLGLLAGFTGLSGPVAAKRVALVIGNDAYSEVVNLKKAVNDAEAMAEALRIVGFEVIRATNVTQREMFRALLLFSSKLEAGDEALFFYAGHGVEISGRNYLLPTDIPKAIPGQEILVTSDAVAVDQVLDQIRDQGTRISILILDACRDNPFAQGGRRSVGGTRGLARSIAPKGTFILYSAGVGQMALDRLTEDDLNANSVFTRNLIPLIKKPGLSLVQTVRQVRKDVEKLAATVSHDQRPAYYDELIGSFFFAGQPSVEIIPAKPPVAIVPLTSSTAPVRSANRAAEVWLTIKDMDSVAVLDAYITEFPDSVYTVFAKARLMELDKARAPAKPPVTVARVAPTSTTQEATAPPIYPKLSQRELATLLQEELNRIGCSAGTADGSWGKKSRAALRSYGRHASHRVASLDPSEGLLQLLRGEKGRICPLACSNKQDLRNGECVAKTCAAGQRLNSGGKCYTPKSQVKRAAKRETKRTPQYSGTSTKPRRSQVRKPPRQRLIRRCSRGTEGSGDGICSTD